MRVRPTIALAIVRRIALPLMATVFCTAALAQQPAKPQAAPQATPQATPQAAPALPLVMLPEKPDLDPKAMEILKASSAKLAAAKTMTFTAVATYESPARTLLPLAYMTLSQVTLERPNKLKVIVPGDGPPSEFYYDGKQMIAYSPQEDVVAVADAPPTIDEMLTFADKTAAISFPFEDVIVSNPAADLAGLQLAFVIGRSQVVGGVATDMVAVANDKAQAQIWIGVDDKLPRMIRVTYFGEPGQFRHVVEFSNWKLDAALPADAFTSEKALKAKRIKFASPDSPPVKP
jgi:hypothetical protein